MNSCWARLICTRLSFNACGDFGIVLEHLQGREEKTDGGDQDEVCYPRHLHSRELAPEDSLRVELWYTDGSRLEHCCRC